MSESGFKFSSYLVSKGLSLWKRERREGGGGEGKEGEGCGLYLNYSVFYFVSVSRLQQKESGSHHKFKRNG